MPQRTCCVPACNSRLSEGAALHAFPNPSNEPEKYQTWVNNVGLQGEDPDYVFTNRRICHLHFEPIYQYPSRRLNRLAIPTLHLPVSETTPVILASQSTSTYTLQPSTNKKEINAGRMISETTPVILASQSTSTYTLQPSTNKKEINAGRMRPQRKYDSNEMELYKRIIKTESELNRCRKAKSGLIQQLKVARKFTRSKAYSIATEYLSPAAKTFFDMQIRQCHKQAKGHRFTLDEKILALSLYKPSPRAYRLLSQICVLPKKTTLNKLMSKAILMPGSNDIIFEHLKKRVDRMPNSHKFCVLLFDEMAISANLAYNKQTDSIKGFCDDGCKRDKSFADHALVFMIRGIFKKYKQPISYTFCAGTTSKYSLKKQITNMIRRILETGLKIVATTCDQGSTNLAAINLLISETKAEYMRQGKMFEGGFFEIDGNKIFNIFDPPHLIKGIRNNLLTKNLEYKLNGRKRTAKWSHVEVFYKRGPGFKGMRLVKKLTARHVIKDSIPKMKVKYSTQVFSRTVSVAMGYAAEIGRIPRECRDTAELLLFFDRLFDSVNGSYNKVTDGKVYRSAVSPKSPHYKLWRKSVPILTSMKFIGGRGGVVPSISSWIKTIQAFQEICKMLHNLGLRSLLLRNFNQDPLENFFGSIRAHGCRNVMPNSVSFENSFKALLINNMISPKSVGANCEEDDSYCLQSLKYFLMEDIAPPQQKEIAIDFNDFNINMDIEVILQSKIPQDIEKCAAAAYCSGWLIKMIHKLISKNCNRCKHDLEGDSEEPFSKFINLKRNTNKSVLHYPSKNFLECLINIENITINILKNKAEITLICEYIALVTTSLVSFDFVTCEEHKEEVKKFIIKKGIIFILSDWCKEINNLLCGKSTEWDEDDSIKEMAHNYYVKHKKRNKKTNL